MKRIAGTALNFFFPGAGYLLVSKDNVKRAYSVLFLIGVIGLTYVELNLQELDSSLYWTMFASVFVMNTAFAIDAWREGAPAA